jgi:hypothetical protein
MLVSNCQRRQNVRTYRRSRSNSRVITTPWSSDSRGREGHQRVGVSHASGGNECCVRERLALVKGALYKRRERAIVASELLLLSRPKRGRYRLRESTTEDERMLILLCLYRSTEHSTNLPEDPCHGRPQQGRIRQGAFDVVFPSRRKQ